MAIRNDFPALVTFPSGEVVRSARAAYVDGFFVVWHSVHEPEGRKIVAVIDETAEPPVAESAPYGSNWTVTNDNGTYRVEPGGGCGCGDPLKRFQADAEVEKLHPKIDVDA